MTKAQQRGKQVKVYLADGTVTGVRYAQLDNWTGQAILVPRKQIADLQSWPECSKPGVYFLVEGRVGDEKPCAYIGEAENVVQRIVSHDKNKEFWHEVIVFTNKDDNLTKSHIKYLESNLVTLAKRAARYTLENSNAPTESSLPRADRDTMDEFIENVRMILGVLGHLILEPVISSSSSLQAESLSNLTDDLTLSINDCMAYGSVTNEGFVLKQGSQLVAENTQSMPPRYSRLKQALLDDGALAHQGDVLVATRDILLGSSSAAATIIAGNPRNGPHNWKDRDGRSLKIIEEEQFENKRVLRSGR